MSTLVTPIPAVTISGGRCPLPATPGPGLQTADGTVGEAVSAWRGQGAHWICLVDADASAASGTNRDEIKQVIHGGKSSARFILMGGIHDQATLNEALTTGATRVVVDVARADRDWLTGTFHEHGQHLIAGLNASGGDLIDASGRRVADLYDTALDLDAAGCPRFMVIEAAQHGHWHHKDKHIIAAVCETVRHPVVAFGGISRLSDLHALAALSKQGLEGVVVGEPLHSGHFTFPEAITALEGRYDPYEWGPPRP